MSIKTTLGQVFSGHVETRENHPDERYQTQYYKTTKDRLMKELLRILNEKKHYEVIDESSERGEISVNVNSHKKFFLVITVIMVRPFRTAVDYSITANRGWDFGFGKKTIATLQGQLSQSFEYIGKSGNQ